jgi:hypothetical protein
MANVSCADCIDPAFSLMRQRLFEPFRFGYCSRLDFVLTASYSWVSG